MSTSSTTRRGCLVYVRRGLLVLDIALFGIIAAGFSFESVMQAGDAERYPPTGQLFTVDGYPMHLDCRGTGSPTVILESGAGGFSVQYAALQASLSAETRICAYDRAGMGWSARRPEPRTAWQIADELHALLTVAHIEPPYVLVGASNGGLYVRAYAAAYPQEVTGMVLLDPTYEHSLADIQSLPTDVYIALGRIGLFRLTSSAACSSCTPEGAAFMAARRGNAATWQVYAEEWDNLRDTAQIEQLKQRLGQAGTLGATPLVVIAANQIGVPLEAMDAEVRAYFTDKEATMRALSSAVTYTLVVDGHGLEQHQALIREAILGIVRTS